MTHFQCNLLLYIKSYTDLGCELALKGQANKEADQQGEKINMTI